MLAKTPIMRLIANPVISPPPNRSPNQMSTIQVIRVEKLPSLMAGQARLKPTSMDEARVRPMRTSSFIRSNISTLASIAMPIVSTMPAMPGKVSVAFKSDSTPKIMATLMMTAIPRELGPLRSRSKPTTQ